MAELRSGERTLVVGGVANFGRFNVDVADQSGDGTERLGMDREIMRVLVQVLGIKRVDFVTMNRRAGQDERQASGHAGQIAQRRLE